MLASAIEEAAWESFEDHAGMSGGLARSSQPSLLSLCWKLQPKSKKRPISRPPQLQR